MTDLEERAGVFTARRYLAVVVLEGGGLLEQFERRPSAQAEGGLGAHAVGNRECKKA